MAHSCRVRVKILGMKPLRFFICALTALWFASPSHAQLTQPSPTPAPATITAQQYRAQLDTQIGELRTMENTPARPLAPWLKNRAKDQIIKREDGATQKAASGEWDRRAIETKGNARKEDVRAIRESLQQRRAALDEWTRRDANGRYFAGSDVQTRIKQLEQPAVSFALARRRFKNGGTALKRASSTP